MGLVHTFIVRKTFMKNSLPDARIHLWQLKELVLACLLDSGHVISLNLDVMQVVFLACQVTEIEQFKLRGLDLEEGSFRILFKLLVIVPSVLFDFIFSRCVVDFCSV